jgi:hypothetical protein
MGDMRAFFLAGVLVTAAAARFQTHMLGAIRWALGAG